MSRIYFFGAKDNLNLFEKLFQMCMFLIALIKIAHRRTYIWLCVEHEQQKKSRTLFEAFFHRQKLPNTATRKIKFSRLVEKKSAEMVVSTTLVFFIFRKVGSSSPIQKKRDYYLKKTSKAITYYQRPKINRDTRPFFLRKRLVFCWVYLFIFGRSS